MLIVFGALKIELIPILRSICIHNTHKNGKTIIYEGFKNSKPVTIIQTGMGAGNARRAAKFFKDNYLEYTKITRPGFENNTEVLVIGFCGATDKSVKAGDIVVYRSIKNIEYSDEKGFYLDGSLELKDRSIYLPVKNTPLYITGANVTKVITDPAVKKKLNSDFSVQAIDMESYCIGEAVREMKLPFSCIRVVSDGAEDVLPSYYENPSGSGMAANIALSFIKSIFSKKEFRSNINAFRNLKKANLKLTKVSEGIISSLTIDALDKTL